MNKCPDAGLMIDFLLEFLMTLKLSYYEDPGQLSPPLSGPSIAHVSSPFSFISQLKLLRYSYSCVDGYAAEKRVLVKDEDLVIDPEKSWREWQNWHKNV